MLEAKYEENPMSRDSHKPPVPVPRRLKRYNDAIGAHPIYFYLYIAAMEGVTGKDTCLYNSIIRRKQTSN